MALGRSRALRVVLAGSFFVFLLRVPPSPAAEETGGLPRAKDVLKKVLERVKRSESQKFDASYAYTSRITIDQFDSKENLKKREEQVRHVFPIDGEAYARLVQKDGKPLSDKEAKHELEREQKFRKALAERRQKNEPNKKKSDEVELNEELASKYRFDVMGRELVNGRPAIVLRFVPRSHHLPIKRRLDRLLNKLAGRVWIDEQDYEISRADLYLADNVTAWGGVLASVRKFVLRFEQTRLDEEAWLPSVVDAYVDGRILVKSLHLKFIEHNSDFRKVLPNPASRARPLDETGRLANTARLRLE